MKRNSEHTYTPLSHESFRVVKCTTVTLKETFNKTRTSLCALETVDQARDLLRQFLLVGEKTTLHEIVR